MTELFSFVFMTSVFYYKINEKIFIKKFCILVLNLFINLFKVSKHFVRFRFDLIKCYSAIFTRLDLVYRQRPHTINYLPRCQEYKISVATWINTS